MDVEMTPLVQQGLDGDPTDLKQSTNADRPGRYRTISLLGGALALVAVVSLGSHYSGRSSMYVNTESATQLSTAAKDETKASSKGALFATVPLKFVVISKKDGTGKLTRASIEGKLGALHKTYNGDDPNAVSKAQASAMNLVPSTPDSCGEKCDVALCYDGGKYKEIVDLSKCYCSPNYCKDWTALGKVHGPRANANIGFKLTIVEHIVNDEWHDQCCCNHAPGLKFKPKQLEIMDKVIDKSKVREEVTVITCDMVSTMGMSIITGSKGCEGGPGITLTYTFDDRTLAHELGHFFGLYHTFNEECPSNGILADCKKADVCNEKENIGDRVADTPIHKKQGSCADTWDADSCPGGGKDPLDNLMSYSGCKLTRFTPGQVTKMHQTITDYYPAFLTKKVEGAPKDLKCDPAFPSLAGKAPKGYAPPPKTKTEVPKGDTSVCVLKKGQCDTHDKQGCTCKDASFCCPGHGCGGMAGSKVCVPCGWADGEPAGYLTKDSKAKCEAKSTIDTSVTAEPPATIALKKKCPLKAGECDTYDKKGCKCTDASFCCAGHGCGGMENQRVCVPCGWKEGEPANYLTKDSCKR